MGRDATVRQQYIENDGGVGEKAESNRQKAEGGKQKAESRRQRTERIAFIKEMKWISHIPQPNLKR